MLVARTPLAPDATVQAVLSQITSGMTFAVVVNVASLGVPGTSSTFSNGQGSAGPAIDRAIGPRARWRASKGLAPVNRFTRSFGDNATEGWHRSMPVGIEVTAGTTATVAAMFVLGASSTAEARATAATIGTSVATQQSEGSAAGAVLSAGGSTATQSTGGMGAGVVLASGQSTATQQSGGSATAVVLASGFSASTQQADGTAAGTVPVAGASLGAQSVTGEASGTVVTPSTMALVFLNLQSRVPVAFVQARGSVAVQSRATTASVRVIGSTVVQSRALDIRVAPRALSILITPAPSL